jgi:hypothetical protein
MSDGPPTISDLISELEALRDEHGDLPVVCLSEGGHYYPVPEHEGAEDAECLVEREHYYDGERVEL